MRIVYDIDDPVQVSGGGSPYANTRGWCGSKGMLVELVLAWEDDAIHIEGDAKIIRKMCEDAINVIDMTNNCIQESLGPHRKTDCPNCEDHWKYPNGTHTENCRLSKEKASIR